MNLKIFNHTDTSIQSKTVTDLLIEASQKGYRKVKVVFLPAYQEELHKNLPTKFVESLKQCKTEIFDVVDEASDIIELLKSKDVKQINFYL